MQTEKFLQRIQNKQISIFGTGYVAGVFRRALQENDLAEHIRCFVISDSVTGSRGKSGGQTNFCGKPVMTLAEYRADTAGTAENDEVLCLAVHESNLPEVRIRLTEHGLAGIWIYPFLFDLLYGKPVCESAEVPVDEILKRQPPGQYWLAVRYGVAMACCEGAGVGGEVYKKAMSLFCTPATAQRRLDHFMRLVRDIRKNGFDPAKPVLLDENGRIIDGLHRIALAAYLGKEALSCRIYAASSLYREILDERNFLTGETLQGPEFSEEDRDWIRSMESELRKKSAPVISVILPVYNVEVYLDTCLQSITEQTFTNYEVLLIDDGSADGSGAACDRWAEKDNRIRVIHQKNRGVSSARNRGIEEARAEWLAFVDPDDWLDRTYLEKLYQAAREKEADFAECDIWRYNNKTGEKIHRSCGGTMGISWTKEEHMIYGSTASYKAISKRSLWTENGIHFPDCSFESPAVYALVLSAADRIVNIPEPLYYYRRFRPDSLIETGYAGKNGEANNTLGIEAMEHLLSEFRRLGWYEAYARTLQRVITFRLSDILATQFYRKNPEDYRETAENFRAFLRSCYPKTEGSKDPDPACPYLIFGGYNMNRILLHCGMLQDPYRRFNFSSLISVAEAGRTQERIRIRHKNRYREIMLQREENLAFWDILEEVRPAFLFMDLIEERFDIIERDGRYVTASDARDGAEEAVPDGTDETVREDMEPDVQNSGRRCFEKIRRIRRNSRECRELFRRSCRQFVNRIHTVSPGTQIVVIENRLCETVGTTEDTRFFDDAEEIRRKNVLLAEMYEELAAADETIFRLVPEKEPEIREWLFTDEKYEYGAIPSHLNEIANRKIAESITAQLVLKNGREKSNCNYSGI